MFEAALWGSVKQIFTVGQFGQLLAMRFVFDLALYKQRSKCNALVAEAFAGL